MRRKRKNMLGVSTVVANMLMILITLSLAAILIAWSGSSYGAFSGGSQIFFQQREQALEERFVIESVFYNTGPKQVLVYVRNVGAIGTSIVAIYANGVNLLQSGYTPSTVCTATTTTTTSTATSISEAITTVCQYTFTYTWTAGAIYVFVAATARGNQVTYVSRAPVGCSG
jgi:hypothetical protein